MAKVKDHSYLKWVIWCSRNFKEYVCALSNDRYGTIHCVSFDSPNQT